MTTYVNLDTIQRASAGAAISTPWGDQVNDNFTTMAGLFKWFNGAAVAAGFGALQIVVDTMTFSPVTAGHTFVYPIATFTTVVIPFFLPGDTADGCTSIVPHTPGLTSVTLFAYAGTATPLNTGSVRSNYILFGI